MGVKGEGYGSLVGAASYPADQLAGQTFYFDAGYVGGKIEMDPEEADNDLFQDLLPAPALPLGGPI